MLWKLDVYSSRGWCQNTKPENNRLLCHIGIVWLYDDGHCGVSITWFGTIPLGAHIQHTRIMKIIYTHSHTTTHVQALYKCLIKLMKRVRKIPKPVVIKSVLVYLCKTLGLRRRTEEYRGGPQSISSLFASGWSLEFTFCKERCAAVQS